MESIEHVQVPDHNRGELLVELIGADDWGSTAVRSYTCHHDGDTIVHLPPGIEDEHRSIVERALRDEGFDVVSDSTG